MIALDIIPHEFILVEGIDFHSVNVFTSKQNAIGRLQLKYLSAWKKKYTLYSQENEESRERHLADTRHSGDAIIFPQQPHTERKWVKELAGRPN